MRRTALGLGVILVVATLAGCSYDAPFDEGSLDALHAAVLDQGLRVCHEDTADRDLPGEIETTTFVLAFDCDSDDTAFMAATEFDDRAARDGAVSQLDVRQMNRAGEAWAYGPFAVVLSGPRDDAVTDATVEALDEVGAH